MARKKPIANLVRIPSEGSGPIWVDGIGNGYREVRDAYLEFLRLMFPVVANREHEVPPVQRHDHHIPCIPDIKQFYGTGIMAPYVQMTPEQQELANALYIEIGKAIRQAYNEGLRNGRNLLLGLAKGEVALSDFDQGITVVTPKDED